MDGSWKFHKKYVACHYDSYWISWWNRTNQRGNLAGRRGMMLILTTLELLKHTRVINFSTYFKNEVSLQDWSRLMKIRYGSYISKESLRKQVHEFICAVDGAWGWGAHSKVLLWGNIKDKHGSLIHVFSDMPSLWKITTQQYSFAQILGTPYTAFRTVPEGGQRPIFFSLVVMIYIIVSCEKSKTYLF